MTKIHELASLQFSDLSVEDWRALFDWVRENGEASIRSTAKTSVRDDLCVFQYWNNKPDAQISELLSITRSICEEDGISWRFFDEDGAKQFLLDELGSRYSIAFDRCFHPAMQADFFRLAFIFAKGGMWLDADRVLKKTPRELLSMGRPVFFQRKRKASKITNWFMISSAGEEIISDALKTCLQNIENVSLFEKCKRTRDVMSIGGPPVLEQAVARALHSALASKNTCTLPVIIDETTHDQLIATGQKTLNEPLVYKSTDRSWQIWRKRKPVA